MFTYAAAASGIGNNVSVDSLAGQLLQRVKLDWGAEGLSVPASGSTAYGLLVDVSRVQNPLSAAQSGSWSVGQAGTWTVQQGSAPWSVSQSGSWNVGQSGAPWSFTLSGTGSVNVANFPTSFNVGNFPSSFNVGNFPATQAVTQSGPWLVNVQNTAAVSGSVTINNTALNPVVVQQDISPWAVTGTLAVTQSTSPWLVNVQNTAAVSGTVSATQSGSWNVGQSGAPWLVNLNNTAAVSGTVTANQGGAPWSQNLTQLGGTSVAVNSGTASNGTQRVVIATDQAAIPVSQSGSWTISSSTSSVTGSLVTLISTEMNSLTNGSITTPATGFNNSAGTYRYADFELLVTYGTNPTAGSQVELYLVPALDSTNYADGSSSVVSVNNYCGGFVLRAVNTAQRIVLREVPLPMCPFKVHVKNSSGQTMAASANTLRMLPIQGIR